MGDKSTRFRKTSWCSFSFWWITPLNLFLVSAGQKLFSCHMCNTSFSTKGSLKVHMRLHTGSKPFKCPFCDLRFRTSGHRKTHIQCHFRPNSDGRKSKRPSSSTGQASQGQDPGAGQAVATGQGQQAAASEALQSVGLLQTPNSDSNIYLPTNQVLTGQFDQNLLQPGLVGQAILPASMSGRNYGWVNTHSLKNAPCTHKIVLKSNHGKLAYFSC